MEARLSNTLSYEMQIMNFTQNLSQSNSIIHKNCIRITINLGQQKYCNWGLQHCCYHMDVITWLLSHGYYLLECNSKFIQCHHTIFFIYKYMTMHDSTYIVIVGQFSILDVKLTFFSLNFTPSLLFHNDNQYNTLSHCFVLSHQLLML